VFCDWTRRPSWYGFASGNDANQNQGWAVRGYPEDDLLDSAKAAPARVEIVDEGYYPHRMDMEVHGGRSYRLVVDLLPKLESLDTRESGEGGP
jgi:hypothetical protein